MHHSCRNKSSSSEEEAGSSPSTASPITKDRMVKAAKSLLTCKLGNTNTRIVTVIIIITPYCQLQHQDGALITAMLKALSHYQRSLKGLV